MACGVPVVMSALPNLNVKSLPPGTVYLSKDNSDFDELIKLALEKEKPAYVEERIKLAARNTWDIRIAEFIKILKDEGLYQA